MAVMGREERERGATIEARSQEQLDSIPRSNIYLQYVRRRMHVQLHNQDCFSEMDTLGRLYVEVYSGARFA